MIERAIYNILKADVGVSALVSSRVYPNITPQDAALPYLVIVRADTEHVESTSGSSGLARASIEVISFSDSYKEVKALAEAVRKALQGYTGAIGRDKIGGIHAGSETDGMGLQAEGGEKYVHWVSFDFSVWYNEDVPL